MIEILKKIPFFAALSDQDMEQIIQRVQMEYFPENHVIFEEGDSGELMYVVKRGKGQVVRENRIVAELGPNDFFGEMALVSDVPRNATVKTLTDMEVLTLNKSDFRHLMETNMEIASKVSKEVISRINESF